MSTYQDVLVQSKNAFFDGVVLGTIGFAVAKSFIQTGLLKKVVISGHDGDLLNDAFKELANISRTEVFPCAADYLEEDQTVNLANQTLEFMDGYVGIACFSAGETKNDFSIPVE